MIAFIGNGWVPYSNIEGLTLPLCMFFVRERLSCKGTRFPGLCFSIIPLQLSKLAFIFGYFRLFQSVRLWTIPVHIYWISATEIDNRFEFKRLNHFFFYISRHFLRLFYAFGDPLWRLIFCLGFYNVQYSVSWTVGIKGKNFPRPKILWEYNCKFVRTNLFGLTSNCRSSTASSILMDLEYLLLEKNMYPVVWGRLE